MLDPKIPPNLGEEVDQLRGQLAAAQAREAELMADNARLREVMDKLARLGNGNLYGTSDGNRIAQSALATIPEQSLARVRNQGATNEE